jgi:epoxyqueuosine reductase
MATLEESIRNFAKTSGFSLVGIAPATEADQFHRLQEWLAKGYSGSMEYMQRNSIARSLPDSILPQVKSVIMVALEYGVSSRPRNELDASPLKLRNSSAASVPTVTGRVARYAAGPDYHDVIRAKLNNMLDWLRERVPNCVGRSVVDTAPLLERDFARRAGIGWIGKNTMLINKHRGSYFFLGALLTDLSLVADSPHEAHHCGTCTACLDACPTDAFPAPGWLDARKCISYLTIELRQSIPLEHRTGIDDWLFGCDVCQEVCPWNRRNQSDAETVDLTELMQLNEEQFRQRYRGTVFFRTKRRGLLRNAAIVLGNVGDERALPALKQALMDEEPLVREAAEWAIEQILGRNTQAES